MKLVMFDIDGTLVDSTGIDDQCFMQTFWDLHRLDLHDVDWSAFEDVTDWGLSRDLFLQHYHRLPKLEELEALKNHFYALLKTKKAAFTAIPGALAFIESLDARPDFALAFATGGWPKTALLKCDWIGLNLRGYCFKSSEDHYQRQALMRLAEAAAEAHYGQSSFEERYYFGDGLWDLKACQELDYHFIGVDHQANAKLKNAGAERIIADFMKPLEILAWI